jgi:hypothetical protein
MHIAMIPLRAYLIPFAVLLLIIAMGRARAEDTIPCPDIRATLATVRSNNPKMTEGQAVEYLAALARSAGASEQFIARARRCLK